MIRSGLRVLVAYHVFIWWNHSEAFHLSGWDPRVVDGVMAALLSACRIAVFAFFVLGLYGLRRLSVREKKRIPVRCWLPWLSIYGWYVMFDMNVGTFILLQLFHALQYIIFPIRVEINSHKSDGNAVARQTRHMVLYYLTLVILGAMSLHMLHFVEFKLQWPFQVAVFLTAAINIHHYFTDAVIWKIRDPEVRDSLFGHLDSGQAS